MKKLIFSAFLFATLIGGTSNLFCNNNPEEEVVKTEEVRDVNEESEMLLSDMIKTIEDTSK